jgi:hypothetical protein
MNRQTIKILTGVGLSILALTVRTATLPAQTPPDSGGSTVDGSAALLVTDSTSGPDGWTGPATLWLDGVEWSGSLTGLEHSDGVVTDSAWHGQLRYSYDFGELGTFELLGPGRTTFDVVEPDYRWHGYKGALRLVDGTGVFAEAQALFEADGYTRWFTDQQPWAGLAGESAPGRIYGLVPEPSSVVLLLLGVLGIASYNGRRKRVQQETRLSHDPPDQCNTVTIFRIVTDGKR